MALTVGGVAIELSADAAQVVSEMERAARATLSASQKMQGGLGGWGGAFRKAESAAAQFAGGITRSFAGIARTVAAGFGISTVLAGGGLAILARQALDTADAIVEGADKAGLATDAYQAYVFQASQAGATQEQLNNALQAFGVRMGEARAGTGALATTMAKLNPALAESLALAGDQDQALRIVAEAMRTATDQADALAIAQAAFGRGGRSMTLVFRDGAAGIDAFVEKARKFGLVINEDLVRGSEAARDQMDLLGQAIKINLTAAVLQAAPAIGQLAEQFAAMIPAIVNFVNQALGVLRPFFADLSAFWQTTMQEFNAIKGVWQDLTDAMAQPVDIGISDALAIELRKMGVTMNQMVAISRDVDAMIDEIEHGGARVEAAAVAVPKLAAAPAITPPPVLAALMPEIETAPAIDNLEALRQKVADVQRAMEIARLGGPDSELGRQLQDLTDAAASVDLTPESLAAAPLQVRELAQAYVEAQVQLRALGAQLEGTAAAEQERLAQLAVEADALAKSYTDAQNARAEAEGATQARVETGGRLPDTIDNATIAANELATTLTDVSNLSFASLGQSFLNIAQRIAEAIIQALIFRAIMAGLGAAGGSQLGLVGVGAVAGRASGGPVSAGNLYRVGGEYFAPSVGGQVLTQSQAMASRQGGQSRGDTYNIYSDQIDPGTVSTLFNLANRAAPGATVKAMNRGLVKPDRRPPN
jgi:hypothetical protein